MGIDESIIRGIAKRLQLSEEEFQQKISILERMGIIAIERRNKGGDIYYPCFIQNQM